MKNNFIKYSLITVFTLLCFQSNAQYGNEWIDYSVTYYKIKVNENRIYRIPKATLDTYGLGAAAGNTFTIYYRGEKIPIYVSNSGTLGSSDYIEFYGEKNDGKYETNLYPNADFQPSDRFSLITDTAVYFLASTAGTHPRMNDVVNLIPVPPPAEEPYFWFESIRNNGVTPGSFFYGRNLWSGSEYTPAATYDMGESRIYGANLASGTFTFNNPLPTLQRYTATPLNAIVQYNVTNILQGSTAKPKFYQGANVIFDTSIYYANIARITKEVATSSLVNSNNFRYVDSSGRTALTFFSVTYPRLFNYSGITITRTNFSLNPNTGARLLNFTNVTSIGTNPILYDLTQHKRYQGLNVTASNASFMIDGSSEKTNLFFTPSNEIVDISTLEPRVFTDYTNAANNGNYLIITNELYNEGSSGSVAAYKTYRNSVAGGAHNTQIVWVNELYDQFGYGALYNPLPIKNFLKYAYNNWSVKPEHVLLLGKGYNYTVYNDMNINPLTYRTAGPIPTFGHPGSDNLFVDFDGDRNIEIAIGRVSVDNTEEIQNYLDKIIQYEAAIKPESIPNLENSLWKISSLFVAGGDKALQDFSIIPVFNYCENAYNDTLTGGVVTTVKKGTTETIEMGNAAFIDSVMNQGISRVMFYGHASSVGFEYNLNEPDNYNSKPKFPIFYAFGCDVAQIFGKVLTIGEKYLKSENGGSVAMIASDNYGFVPQLSAYARGTWNQISKYSYDKTLGQQIKNNLPTITGTDELTKMHKDCMILQGDPALHVYNPELPDYYIEASLISSPKAYLTSADDSFRINAKIYNLAKATNDAVAVTLEHQRPDGSIVNFHDTILTPIKNYKDFFFALPLDPLIHSGLNKFTIKVNASQSIEEISYSQNEASIIIFVADNGIKPVFPYDFSIVHEQGVELKAHSINTFEKNQKYIIQIDTTERFNSSSLISTNITGSLGGLIKWKPALTMKDSMVYYWRCSIDTGFNQPALWESSSFIYLENGSDGWNQSHYYQYDKNRPYKQLQLKEDDRNFKFTNVINDLNVRNRVYNTTFPINEDIAWKYRDTIHEKVGCNLPARNTLKIAVFDTFSGDPMFNNGGDYGSQGYCFDRNRYQFEFSLKTPENRQLAADFINGLPNGKIVMIQNFLVDYGSQSWDSNSVDKWVMDESMYGAGNTLRDRLIQLGFDQIDSFNKKRVFIFLGQKGNPTYSEKYQEFSEGDMDLISHTFEIPNRSNAGSMKSVLIGPATEWQTLMWKYSLPLGESDSNKVILYGVDPSNNRTQLYAGNALNVDLSFINATDYPRIELIWEVQDDSNRTASNLDYWRILYKPLPEAALNPIVHFTFTDSINQGENMKLAIAIENLTKIPMDSMLVHYKIIDANGVSNLVAEKRYDKLAALDTINAELIFDPKNFPGNNVLVIEANPNNDQPEQYHPNNIGFLNFQLIPDNTNPVLDVTFDGVHILDRDIVSAKPFIKVLLRDENLFAKLSDTSLISLSLLYPNSTTPLSITMDGTIAKFIPATDDKKNEASLEFKPFLDQDGVYKLIATAKDEAGNNSASNNAGKYEIQFTIDNKPTVTNLLNYPNPFSTSTAFVFTMTGAEIPQQFKIQIMTVTGKVVREITKQELGTIRIGRNITEYKWDGKDQYGQLLGNGVYLYRLVTLLNGKELEHRSNAQIDKYFKSGFGKMYIMR